MSVGSDDATAAVRRRVEHLLGPDLTGALDDERMLAWAGTMELSRLLPAKHDREMQAEHGLSLTLLSLLGRLDDCDQAGLQARDLAVDVHLSPGRVSRHLATLERAGLLTRSHNADDGRALDVKLTRAGRERLAQARRTAVAIVERDVLSPLTPEEVTALARIAAKLLRANAGG